MPVNGCPVTFTVDNSNFAFFPIKNTNVTGSNGETILVLSSTDMSGTVTVTAEAKAPGSTNAITATITLTVVDWGTIGGTVFNQTSSPVAGAGSRLKMNLATHIASLNNPQNTSTWFSPVGSFVFFQDTGRQLYGELDFADMSGSLPVTVSAGTATVIFNENRSLLFPDYKDAPGGPDDVVWLRAGHR